MPISEINEAPTFLLDGISTLNNELTYVEGRPLAALDSTVAVYDLELSQRGNYGGASITIMREDGANSEDIFSGIGGLVIGAEGNDVTLGGNLIGTSTVNSGGKLTITFNENADQTAVNEALSSIGYSNFTDGESVSASFEWTFSDGNEDSSQGSEGAKSAIGTTTVNIVRTADAVKTIQDIDFNVAIPLGGTAPVLSVAIKLSGTFDQVEAHYYLSTESGGLGSQQTFTLTYNPATEYYEYSVTLSKYAASGEYILSSVRLKDSSGELMVDDGEMTTKGFDIKVDFVNPHPDTAIPVLNSASFGDFYQDDDGFWYLPFEVNASDSGSGLSLAETWVDLILPTGGMPKSDITFDENGHAEGVFKFNQYTPSGAYTFQSVRLEDLAGNGTYSKKFFLDHPVTATLENPDSDSVKATLSEFSMTAVLDEATDRPRIIVNGYANDELSGMEQVYLVLKGPAGTNASYYYCVGDNLLNDDLDMNLDGQIGLTSDYFCGTYTVDLLRLMDRAQNESDYSAASLKTLGLSYAVNVYFPNKPGISTVNGSSGNDYVFGTNAGSETLYAGGGNDIVIAGGGNDLIIGGDGAGNDSYLGGDGIDTVKYTSARAGITVNLALGTATSTAGKNAAGIGDDVLSSIENVIGGNYNDVIIGDAGVNDLSGGSGNDFIDGGFGADSMHGGSGNDTYIVEDTSDSITENSSAGTDNVRSYIASYTLADNLENLTLMGFAINGTGNGLMNVMTGNAAANALNGEAGADTMAGGAGDDTLNGGAGNDTLKGEAGDDVMNGGLGSDIMLGGAGNDTYYVDGSGDRVYETTSASSTTDAGGTADKVISSISWSLGSFVENLTLTGSANINGTGNGLANLIIGNEGINILKGGSGNDALDGGAGNDTLDGGTGDDTMTGGTGDDTYVLSSVLDVVVEEDGAGMDLVKVALATAGSTYELESNVENATITSTVSIDLTGNGLANTLIGNATSNELYGMAGADTLKGGAGNDVLDGGAGIDQMYGGSGNDTYYVDNEDDEVFETTTSSGLTDATGVDWVISSVDWVLGSYVENLRLSGTAISGTGNSLANMIHGNAEGNTLKGEGGADKLYGGLGNDSLAGGTGADIFVFDTSLDAATNVDVINDFVAKTDKLHLDSDIFARLTTIGTLAAGRFVSEAGEGEPTANDANDYILYDKDTGDLFYDADGNGVGAAVKFATLIGAPNITATDLVVI